MPDLSPREEKIEVRQCDREAAAAYIAVSFGERYRKSVLHEGRWPDLAQAFARHRQAAEAAAIERAAAYVEGAGGVIPAASVFAALASGNNMPCMSGDARDRLHPHQRRQFDSAMHSLSTAIRRLGAGEG